MGRLPKDAPFSRETNGSGELGYTCDFLPLLSLTCSICFSPYNRNTSIFLSHFQTCLFIRTIRSLPRPLFPTFLEDTERRLNGFNILYLLQQNRRILSIIVNNSRYLIYLNHVCTLHKMFFLRMYVTYNVLNMNALNM